jgi:general secretion pathway protein J
MTRGGVKRGGPSAGFTLLELLVAVGVFTVLAAIAYGALQTVLTTHAHTDEQMQHLAQLQTALTMMERDIEQAVGRGVRDEFGDPLPPMMGIGDGGDGGEILEFTRMGWRNPTTTPRSYLQRVAYAFKDNTLTRRYWRELDRTQESEPLDSDLLDDVNGVEARFLDSSAQWHDQWPPVTGNQQSAPTILPRAVEITVDTRYWGKITRLFRVPG